MNFNPDQEAAANSIDGVYVVVAGPGSGKTTVLIERFVRMLIRKIDMKDILNLTFTSAAAEEMVKRAGLINADSIFRTFHSFALELIKKERDHLPFKLIDTVLPFALEDYKLLFHLTDVYKFNNYHTLKEKISEWKRSDIEPEQAIEEAADVNEYRIAEAYQEYETKCREQGWLDFDSLMRETVKLLEENDEVRNRWKRKYISVDECQDTDVVQFRLLQLIFGGNIFVVGDENQLIYEWRSAQSGNLTNFERIFPGASKLYLGHNYRSTEKLVSFFKEIIPIDNGIASRMVTNNPSGIEPTITRYRDDDEEAVQVLRQITEPTKSAVIARTNRQLFIFQRICTMRNIKYRILGKKDFWEQNEVKRLLQLAKDSHSGRPAAQVLSELIEEHDLLRLYRNSGRPIDGDPVENLNAIVKMAGSRDETIPQFLDRLRKITHKRRSEKGLTLSTVHQAKGREWDHVFVVGVNHGKMPHTDGETNEEKRIFFVACSRAAKTLNISFSGIQSMFLNDYEDDIKYYEPEVGEVSEDPGLLVGD